METRRPDLPSGAIDGVVGVGHYALVTRILPRPRSGQRLNDHLVNSLSTLCDRLNGLMAPDSNGSPYDRYFRWVQDAADVLQRWVIEDDVRRYVLTDGFRLIAGASLNTATSRLVYVEIEARRQQWTEMLTDISGWRHRWRDDQVVVVPDTNVLLQHEQPLTGVPWRTLVDASPGQDVRVVLPLVILDQLDSLKRGNNFPAWKKGRLRLTVNWIRDNLVAHEHRAFLHPTPELHGDTTLEILVDDLMHVRHAGDPGSRRSDPSSRTPPS